MCSLAVVWSSAVGVPSQDHPTVRQENHDQAKAQKAVLDDQCGWIADTLVTAVLSWHRNRPERQPSCCPWSCGQAYEGWQEHFCCCSQCYCCRCGLPCEGCPTRCCELGACMLVLDGRLMMWPVCNRLRTYRDHAHCHGEVDCNSSSWQQQV